MNPTHTIAERPSTRLDCLPLPDGYCALCGQSSANIEIHAMVCKGAPELRSFKWTHPVNGPAVVSLTFRNWMRQVSLVLVRRCGLSVDDLPDWESWEAWNAGETPWQGATLALCAADYPFDEEAD